MFHKKRRLPVIHKYFLSGRKTYVIKVIPRYPGKLSVVEKVFQ
jgi:hypothetical protein